MSDDVCIFCSEGGSNDSYRGQPAHRGCLTDYLYDESEWATS